MEILFWRFARLGNPRCEKCGFIMYAGERLVESRRGVYGIVKYWICKNNKKHKKRR